MTNPKSSFFGEWKTPPLFMAKLSGRRRIIVWVIALLFTALAVNWSTRNARLAQDPTYDDVGYFIDATERLAVLDAGGLRGLFHNFVHDPPHTVFSTVLGMASFQTLGINDWAPYAFNGFILAAFLFFCCRIYGDLPNVAFYSLLVYCLSIPFALRAIHDFRPDFTAALVTAVFVWFGLAAVTGREEDETRNSVLGGVFFGAALWIKPTIFAHTLVIALVTGVCIAAGFWLPGRRVDQLKRGVFCALRFGGLGVLLGAPYYLLNGRQTLEYFKLNTQGADAHIASFKGSAWGFLRAFTIDGAQALTFGPHLWLMLACCILGLVWALRRRRYPVAFQIAGLLLTAAASLTVFVYGRHNNEYFGLPYQMFVVAAGLTSLAAIIREYRRALLLAPALLLVSCTPPFFLPPGSFWATAAEADVRYGWNRKLVEALLADSGFRRDENRLATPAIPVYVDFAGSVNGNSMRWICVKERLPFVFSDLHRTSDPAAQLKMARKCAYAVLCTSTATSLYSALPSGQAYDNVLKTVRADPNFREVKITSEPKPPYRLYQNLPVAEEFSVHYDVSIDWPTSGLLEPEGPYPQWHLPKVRWGAFPSSAITVTTAAEGTGTLKFSVKAELGTVVQVGINGKAAGEHTQKTTTFEWAEFPLPLHPGENIVKLEYHVPGKKGAAGERAVLFRHLEIVTPP